ncbi:MAG: glucose-1-phosphate thymidylyltransferase RfbA [Candidatus Methanomethylophilaceae archaeon]|nr:glucose-1-phosphate thymidylyltransferase RfbA [Candidatus Methanomethylophilaceae archaeon]
MPPSKITKGIILAAGAGTRLYPSTFPISKILLPVYDRPMVYYPLFTLMSAGIRDILIITNERDRLNFERTLRDGSQFGVRITYEVQQVQRGIADAFIIGEKFTDGGPCVLILGDNIFHGEDLDRLMEEASKDVSNATVFAHWVPDPERFGVAEFDRGGNVISLEEKPKNPKSNYAVIGLYFLPGDAVEKAKTLKPSARGELEITDLNLMYLREGRLKVKTVSDDTVWMDAGTFDSLLDSANYIKDMDVRRETKILCPEIEALRKGYVTKEQMAAWIEPMKEGDYYKGVIKFMGTM